MPPCLPPLYFLRQGLSPCYTESSGFQLANPPESSCVSPQCCAGIAGIYCHTQLLFGCWSSKYPGPFLRAHIYHPAVNTKTLLTVVCRNLSKKNGFRKEFFFSPFNNKFPQIYRSRENYDGGVLVPFILC